MLPESHSWVSDAVKNRDPGKEKGAFLGLRSGQAGLHLSPALVAALDAEKDELLPFPHPTEEFQRGWDTIAAALPLG